MNISTYQPAHTGHHLMALRLRADGGPNDVTLTTDGGTLVDVYCGWSLRQSVARSTDNG